MGWQEDLSQRSEALAGVLAADWQFMAGDTALPKWVKHLMALQLDSVFNHPAGARYYGSQALEAGATEEQLLEAIELLRMYAGRPAMATAAAAFEKG
ncbi:MAG: carboxymuconolactone decarboxylase family protein [Spirochaetota bacterium]